MEKEWPGQNTVKPAQLIAHYQRGKKQSVWRRSRYFYEVWRKTTGMIDPPPPWDELDPRMQVAMCALAQVVAEDAAEAAAEQS